MAVTFAVLWPALTTRWKGLLDPYSFNGDALQHIAPMWFVHTVPEAVQDYTLRYYLHAILPPLFKGIYAVLTLALTPPAASKLVTVVLSVVFIASSVATTRMLAGSAAAALTLFLATGGVLKNFYFMGGIQRGFGFCLASLALYLVCRGHVLSLAGLAVVAALLYPAASVCILTVLGLLIVLPSAYRGSLQSWNIKRRVVLLAATTALIAVAVTPQLLGGHRYGSRLSIEASSHYEEWGPHGRYTPGDRGVPVNLVRKITSGALSALSAVRPPKSKSASYQSSSERVALLVIAGSLFAAGALAVARRSSLSPNALRCGVFFLGSVVSFIVASALFPLLYIPSRYIALGLTALSPVVFPALWATITRCLIPDGWSLRRHSVATLALGTVLIISLGWLSLAPKRLPTASGYRELFAFFRGLPRDTVLASWPRGIANMVPLFTGRSILMFEEGHQIFHRDFVEELRRRGRALIAAYAATDREPFRELHRSFNVSYVLVNRRHLNTTPDYFAPFDKEMEAAREKVGAAPLALSTLVTTRAVFSNRDYVVIDIRGL